MRDIEKYLAKNITKDKISKLNKVKFLKVFLEGSDYLEDFLYLEKEMPEYLDSLYLKDTWTDVKYPNIQRVVDGNNCILLKKNSNTDSQLLITFELKFRESGDIKFARYSPDGMFSRIDTLIPYNGIVYNGNIPESEFFYPLKSTSSPFEKVFTLENKFISEDKSLPRSKCPKDSFSLTFKLNNYIMEASYYNYEKDNEYKFMFDNKKPIDNCIKFYVIDEHKRSIGESYMKNSVKIHDLSNIEIDELSTTEIEELKSSLKYLINKSKYLFSIKDNEDLDTYLEINEKLKYISNNLNI